VELHDYVGMLRKHVRLITAVFVAAVLSAAAYAYQSPKVYRSQIRLFVSAQSQPAPMSTGFIQDDSYTSALLSAERVKSYAALIQGPRVADLVAERLKFTDPNGKPIHPHIQASAPVETVLIDVAATDTDPARAQATANAAGDVFVELVDQLEKPPGAQRPSLRVTVVERAKLPLAPIAPRKKLIVLMGGFFGLAGGVGLAALRHKLDTSVKTPEEIAAATGAPVVGLIGYDSATAKRPLVVHAEPRSPNAEAFRQLRTNIRFVNIDSTMRSVIVTSAVANEGKSTVSCNLAIALAQAGQRVVLVEADLRKPSIRTYLGIEGAVGLTNLLLGEADLEDVLQPWGDGLLQVLPGGLIAPNPSELLGSAAMVDVIGRLEAIADLVIFDVPPLLPVTDAAVLGVNTDGAVLVVRSGSTSRERLDRAVESLGGVGVRVVGSVLNMAATKGPDSVHYYHYYGQDVRRGRFGRRKPPAPIGLAPLPAEPAAARRSVSAGVPRD
jgi:capsular exopolysaccharide synthesis family protein